MFKINGLFGSLSYVQSLTIRMQNVQNPSPAITTDNFIVQIGNDVSLNTSVASITLTPTKLSLVNATFDPKTVNTTGNLILTFKSQNIIKAGSNLVVTFPILLVWTR